MTRNKLALGNVPGPLAAIWSHRNDLSGMLATLHEDFSLVSQIINDFGDHYGFAGFHMVGPCTRDKDHEAKRKPNIHTIWRGYAEQNQTYASVEDWALQRAKGWIRNLTSSALTAFERLNINGLQVEVLLDFFKRPLAEFERATNGGPLR
jgi:hypothetical protein